MFNNTRSAAIQEIAFKRLKTNEKIVFAQIAENITALNKALYRED